MSEFDHGPSAQLAQLFDRVPDPPVKDDFWFDWGPIFYRGRLDGSARVMCVASDPGPTERIAGRSLVGNAGQRVQGLLAKLGLTRSYVCLNAWAYAVHPSRAWARAGPARRPRPARVAKRALRRRHRSQASGDHRLRRTWPRPRSALWSGRPDVPLNEVPHPSSRDETELLDEWRAAVAELRAIVTPDGDGDNGGPNYGAEFSEADYAAIPRRDLPFGAPAFLGDDAWVRAGGHGAQNSVARPSPDDGHTLIWHAPRDELGRPRDRQSVP